jgi:hypothetical protein
MMAPDEPETDNPVLRVMDPLTPSEAVPLPTARDPLTPTSPAFADRRLMFPLEDFDPSPDLTATSPPDVPSESAVPADTNTVPPTASVPLPTCNAMLPAAPSADACVVSTTEPELPALDVPVVREI